MPRKDIAWLNLDEPCMSLHTCNAFDQDDDTVVMDLIIHPKAFPEGAQGSKLVSTTFERWTLNLNTGRIDRKVISSELQEFPRFDERLTTKPYRYAYTIDANPDFVHSNRSIFRDGLEAIAASGSMVETDTVLSAIAKFRAQISTLIAPPNDGDVTDIGGEGYYPFSQSDGVLYTTSQNYHHSARLLVAQHS